MKYINKIGMTVVAGTLLATTACSDFSDYNTIPDNGIETSNKTLWETIKSNGELTQFAAIIEKAGYIDNLNSSRFVTVWAPKDGTYKADSVLNLSDKEALNYFVKHHVADYAHRTVDAANQPVVMTLDKKLHPFSEGSFGRVSMLEKNIPASNGVLHVLNSNDPFFYNISESISDLENCDNFSAFIGKFHRETLDKANSVIGPVIDGKQTYLDSVIVVSNDYFTSTWRAKLESEDSLYTILAPTDKAWNDAYSRISPLYRYPSTAEWFCLDTLQLKNTSTKATASGISSSMANAKSYIVNDNKKNFDAAYYTDSLTKYSMLANLVFSMNDTYNKALYPGASVSPEDSLRSTTRRKFSNVAEIINSTVGEVRTMSNGYLRYVDNIAQKSWEVYNPVLSYRDAARGVNCTPSSSSYVISEMTPEQMEVFSDLPGFIKKSLFPQGETKFRYIHSLPKASTSSPELDIALRNVMATKYRVLVVTLPSQIVMNSTAAERPQQLQFILMNLKATETDGIVSVTSEKVGGTKGIPAKLWAKDEPFEDKTNNGKLTLNAGKANLIDLGEIEFPVCCSGIDIYPSLMIVNSVASFTSSNLAKWEQRIRVAKVLLIPTDRYDSFINEE